MAIKDYNAYIGSNTAGGYYIDSGTYYTSTTFSTFPTDLSSPFFTLRYNKRFLEHLPQAVNEISYGQHGNLIMKFNPYYPEEDGTLVYRGLKIETLGLSIDTGVILENYLGNNDIYYETLNWDGTSNKLSTTTTPSQESFVYDKSWIPVRFLLEERFAYSNNPTTSGTGNIQYFAGSSNPYINNNWNSYYTSQTAMTSTHMLKIKFRYEDTDTYIDTIGILLAFKAIEDNII